MICRRRLEWEPHRIRIREYGVVALGSLAGAYMGLAGPNISATAVNNPVDLELGPELVGRRRISAVFHTTGREGIHTIMECRTKVNRRRFESGLA